MTADFAFLHHTKTENIVCAATLIVTTPRIMTFNATTFNVTTLTLAVKKWYNVLHKSFSMCRNLAIAPSVFMFSVIILCVVLPFCQLVITSTHEDILSPLRRKGLSPVIRVGLLALGKRSGEWARAPIRKRSC